MKLRTRSNAIRLRLGRTEIDKLIADTRIEEVIELGPSPNDRLVYALGVEDDAGSITARIEGGSITVTIPTAQAREWAATERVGLEAEQPIGGGKTLGILIEKDFACLTPRANEDDGDAFKNPNATC